jgi:tetratricopeptide (TPR) repeat protein
MTYQNYLEQDQQAVEQVKVLLESGKHHNIELAFQLIKGGGLAKELVTHLYALSIFYTDDDTLKRRAKLYYKNIASPALYEFTKYKWNVYGEYYNENKMTEFLSKLGDHPELNHKVLANMALIYASKGAKYCLENDTAPPEQIIAQLIDQDMLDLDYMNLNHLPKEVGMFDQIKFLYLEGNNFTDIPDELAQLTQLQALSYKNTPLTEEALQKLETFFPRIFATQYYMEVIDDINQGINYDNSLRVLNKILALDVTYATAWNDKGRVLQESGQSEKSLECYDQYLKYAEYESDKALSRVNKALALQKLGWTQALEETAQEAREILKQIPKANRDRVYYFSEGLALFFTNDYENALKAYDQGLAHDQYDGVLWYNKACTYARQGNLQEMTRHLKRAIELRERFRVEAKEDVDFKDYWKNEEFLKVIKDA